MYRGAEVGGNGITNEGIKRVATLQSLEGLYIRTNFCYRRELHVLG